MRNIDVTTPSPNLLPLPPDTHTKLTTQKFRHPQKVLTQAETFHSRKKKIDPQKILT